MARALSLVLFLSALVGLAVSQQVLLNIEGIPTSSLFYPNALSLNGQISPFANSAFGLGRPLDPPLLPPVSQRTIYKIFNPFRLVGTDAIPIAAPASYTSAAISNFGPTGVQNVAGLPVGVQRNEVILLRFAAPVTSPPRLILQQPNLDVDPYGCGGVDPRAAQMGACRCLDRAGYTPSPIQCAVANVAPTADPTLVFCQVPTATLFPFAPVPGENPFIRSYRRICLQSVPLQPPAPVVPAQFLDTQLWYSVQHGCVDDAAPDAGNVDPALLFRCNNNAVLGQVVNYPGVVGATPVSFTLADPNVFPLSQTLGPFLVNNGNNFAGQQIPAQFIQNGEAFNGESPVQRQDRLNRGVCCGYRIEGGVADLGVCINPAQGTGCCGTKPYDLSADQCCTRTPSRVRVPATGPSVFDARTNLALINLQEFFPQVPTIRSVAQPCPCNNANRQVINGVAINTDCASYGANLAIANDNTGLTNFASRLECCVGTRFPQEYPNFIAVSDGAGGTTQVPIPKQGFCYDPLNVISRWQCCDDGNIFDADSQQCCRINGVQSQTEGCPCEVDTDCANPVGASATSRCCKQRFPSPRLQPESRATSCSPYANFPTPSTLQQATQNFLLPVGGVFPPNSGGNAPNEIQRCTGRCIDTQWQICCNGVVCVGEFERCCNDTCCNKHTQTCVDGFRPGSLTSRFNSLNYQFEYEICSSIEAMNGRRAFNIFIVPVFLLFATVASLALLITFTRRAVEHVFELTERAIVFLAAFSVLIATVYFFSPMYKFGITIIWINLALIAIAAIRTIRPAILAVVLQFLLILYIIDPFPANHWFGMSHGATGENELADHDDLPSSLFETAYYWWRDRGVRCTRHYDYFNFDFNARDTLRHHNPAVRTFGYCSREWISTLMIFAGFLIITELLLLLLVIYSLVKLLGFKPEEVVQLEVVAEPNY